MMFNVGDKVRVVRPHDADTRIFVNHVGTIIEADETRSYPYTIKFADEYIQLRNEVMGEVIWKEYQLKKVPKQASEEDLQGLVRTLDRCISDLAKDHIYETEITLKRLRDNIKKNLEE